MCFRLATLALEEGKQGDTGSNLVKEIEDIKGEHHPNRVQGQLRQDYIVKPKQTPDKLRDRKPETAPQSILINR